MRELKHRDATPCKMNIYAHASVDYHQDIITKFRSTRMANRTSMHYDATKGRKKTNIRPKTKTDLREKTAGQLITQAIISDTQSHRNKKLKILIRRQINYTAAGPNKNSITLTPNTPTPQCLK